MDCAFCRRGYAAFLELQPVSRWLPACRDCYRHTHWPKDTSVRFQSLTLAEAEAL